MEPVRAEKISGRRRVRTGLLLGLHYFYMLIAWTVYAVKSSDCNLFVTLAEAFPAHQLPRALLPRRYGIGCRGRLAPLCMLEAQ